MASEYADSNPNMPESDNMDHWKVILKSKGKQLTTYFSKGYGHNGKEPIVEEVLDCLASDASGFDNARSFEDWASEYGYDEDSRKAEKIYNTISKEAKKLKAFLGDEAYESLLWKTERY
jgi:hypothetical protein